MKTIIIELTDYLDLVRTKYYYLNDAWEGGRDELEISILKELSDKMVELNRLLKE
jgi:hypothetical protein